MIMKKRPDDFSSSPSVLHVTPNGVGLVAPVLPERDAPDSRLVIEACIVVEVDTALRVFLIRDVATEDRHFPFAFAMDVAGTKSAFEIAIREVLSGFVKEEVRLPWRAQSV